MGDSDASTYKKKIDESSYAYKVDTRMVGGENKDGSFTSFNWGNTASAGSLTLALHSDLLSASENSTIKANIMKAADEYIACENEQGYGIPYKYDGAGYNVCFKGKNKLLVYASSVLGDNVLQLKIVGIKLETKIIASESYDDFSEYIVALPEDLPVIGDIEIGLSESAALLEIKLI